MVSRFTSSDTQALLDFQSKFGGALFGKVISVVHNDPSEEKEIMSMAKDLGLIQIS